MARLSAIAKRNGKECGYIEVSPGNWVNVDCKRYGGSSRAVPHLSPRKTKVYYAHKQLFRPVKRLGVKRTDGPPNRPPDPVPVPPPEPFPSNVDHRALGLESPVKDQGSVGSCTAHSLSSAIDNAAIRSGRLKAGNASLMSAPLHVWSRYGTPNMGFAADANIAQAVAPDPSWPQDDRDACKLQVSGDSAAECGEALEVVPGSWRSDAALVAKYNRAQSEGLYKLASVERLVPSGDGVWSKEEILTTLASGADLWVAMVIDSKAWAMTSVRSGVIGDWSRDTGAHAVTLSGYRETTSGRQYLVHNSWGESWGDRGYAWINETMLDRHMFYAYRLKITNPVPKEDLTDDDCAPEEVIDLGTGFCTVICPDASRPNNGCR